jgi:hypothetical protein
MHVKVGGGYPKFYRWRKKFFWLFGGRSMPKLDCCFWRHIAAELRHTLKNYEVGYLNIILRKKIIYCKKGVEVWEFDGSVERSNSDHFGNSK